MATFDGVSLVPLFATGEAPCFDGRALYYAFYENPGEHNAPIHDGIRTDRYTLARIYSLLPGEDPSARRLENEWMLFDNEKDPHQMRNVIADPAYADVLKQLKQVYADLRAKYKVDDEKLK